MIAIPHTYALVYLYQIGSTTKTVICRIVIIIVVRFLLLYVTFFLDSLTKIAPNYDKYLIYRLQ